MSFFHSAFNTFTKITGWPLERIFFRTKVYYEDKSVQSGRIRGSAIIISNHTSLYDYAVMLFVFFTRTLRYQMAEVLFRKKLLSVFLKAMGGIYVDRNTYDFGFLRKSEAIIRRGGVVGIFPEGRIPEKHESTPLEFHQSAAMLALATGAKIIPVYTDGRYFRNSPAHVIVGKPVDAGEFYISGASEKENLAAITVALRQRIIVLKDLLDEKTGQKDIRN